ncbi:MAG: flagellar biosynthesis anti-sigma factor FlgM [Sphingomonadaceae bacterium]|nr:flagellar biosynthesis anti-sigma factor FlgM [Sphingomonadaceae bacterium]
MNPVDPGRVSRPVARFEGTSPSPVSGPAKARPVSSENAALTARDAGPAAPVDTDRVSEIRKAVEQGTYPLTPAKIADAMIAAGYLLRHKA